ncbi:MAG: tyrosine-type recombinase/integrase [Cyanobacteria bacterium P01_H01_bin.153]
MSLHSFRRSQATHLHQAGVPLRAIQRITGYKSLSALERYLDISAMEAAVQQQAVLDGQWGEDVASKGML